MQTKFASQLLFSIASLICFASTPAKSNEMTAGDLYSFCMSPDQVASTTCRFFVLGIVQGVQYGDGSTMNGEAVKRKKTILCLPDNVSESQTLSIVKDALKQLLAAYPGDKDLAATGVIVAAIYRKFPCQK